MSGALDTAWRTLALGPHFGRALVVALSRAGVGLLVGLVLFTVVAQIGDVSPNRRKFRQAFSGVGLLHRQRGGSGSNRTKSAFQRDVLAQIAVIVELMQKTHL